MIYMCVYVCLYIKIRRHQHTRVYAHTTGIYNIIMMYIMLTLML